MDSLLPDRHPNYDLFTCDVLDAIPKDDMASMEHPVFSLSTKPDVRSLHYEHNGNTLDIIPSTLGLATIHDKDVLIYIVSQLVAKINQGETPRKRVRITAYDLLVSTNRPTNNLGYDRLKAALDRLSGTRIKTNIKTNGIRIIENFGLIDAYGIIEKSPTDGRMIGIQVKISDWLFNAVCAKDVLTIHKDYFRLRKPIERRIYELARKHCGNKKSWRIGLSKLQKKTGSKNALRDFRRTIRVIIENNHLPQYCIDIENDIVTFSIKKKKGRGKMVKLSTETFEKAKQITPGQDIYQLEQEWREWVGNKKMPKDPDAAFLGFCQSKYQ